MAFLVNPMGVLNSSVPEYYLCWHTEPYRDVKNICHDYVDRISVHRAWTEEVGYMKYETHCTTAEEGLLPSWFTVMVLWEE